MKVFDRYTGTEVELPDEVESGRYRLLQPTVLNRAIELSEGSILWSDGSSACGLNGESSRSFVTTDERQTIRSEIDVAVEAVVEQLDHEGADLPSPIMPAVLGELAAPSALELALSEVLERGHLHSISDRPRRSMRYDTELLPVSLARRIAKDAIVRLASHSEDWLRREISGVTPRAIKAEISDDDLAIYENIVYARLLDQLEKVLRARRRQVEDLCRKHEQAKKILDAERLDYRLRVALCSLWGLSFSDAPEAGGEARDTLGIIGSLLGRIRELKRRDLYRAIPASLRVPLALRNTNVLLYDQHYRHLRGLWALAHADIKTRPQGQEETFLATKHRGETFSRYVGLLVFHALAACRLLRKTGERNRYLFGGRSLAVNWDRDLWRLTLEEGNAPLYFVPAERGSADWLAPSNRRIVFIQGSGRRMEDTTSDWLGADGVLNPLQFYGVERIRQAVEQWLMSELLGRYPFKVEPVPSETCSRFKAMLADSVGISGQGLEILRPVGSVPRGELEIEIATHPINERTRRALTHALDDMNALAMCRLCGESVTSRSFYSSSEGFKAVCGCGQTWTLKLRRGQAPHADFFVGEGIRPFDEVGALQLTFLAQHPAGVAVIYGDKATADHTPAR